ncbi:miniconductance mechanosensitive channel [[Pantoea] beijingensis]|uniref:Mechanosensing system component YbdG n=1 Tax=[Pantoea] beijingensis TaxID=1324864 RepID=A0A443I8X5_9GAMM|nr:MULTISPECIES: mechanosensitive ion channel family protein [Erwiniaceae]RWR00631.1 miniconductance mechanosensitive channel [[Pantoea] beijingensis]
MQYQIQKWLEKLGIHYTEIAAIIAVILLIVVISLIVHGLLRRLVLPFLQHRADSSTRQWPKVLMQHKLFSRVALLAQGILLQILSAWFLSGNEHTYSILLIASQIWVTLFSLWVLFSLLDVLLALSANSNMADQLPLRGIFQSIKLIAAIVVGIMIVSILIGKSPLVLITGLGAMTAVLMLVFKDPILGLVAGIQLSANNMLKLNDWLEMPKYGADGAVVDIGLTTVKVRNWDNTITTIPTYALISDSFKNWRAMSESGGRRIKRSINIDATSIHFLSNKEMDELKRAQLLAPYIDSKRLEVGEYNALLDCDLDTPLNGRHLTNIGTFRIWLESWLKSHPRTHKGMTLMVRQLAPTPEGLPIEIYAFANTTVWLEYERIQSDIFDHIFAALPAFGLRVHQTPTGHDMRNIGVAPQP